MIEENDDIPWLHQVLLPVEILAQSPSSRAEITNEMENRHRTWGLCLFIIIGS